MVKKILQLLFFVGLGVVILKLVYDNQNTAFQEQCRLDGVPTDQCSLSDKLLHDFSTVHVGWLSAVVLAFTLSNIFRALRWQMLLKPLDFHPKFSNSFLTILLGYFANLGFPRMGEVVRAGSLARYEKLPLEKVMGTLVIDRLMDFVCLGLVVGLAFLLEGQTLLTFLSESGSGGEGSGHTPILLLALFVFVAGIATMYLLRKWLLTLKIVQKLLKLLMGFWEGLKSVFRMKNPPLFIAYSLGIWLMFYLQCYFNLKAFDPTAHLSASAALMVFVFGTLGFVIPSPGGMGTFHALCIAGLALYGINGGDAFSYANIAFFTIQIFYNVVAGIASLILLPLLNRSKEKETAGSLGSSN